MLASRERKIHLSTLELQRNLEFAIYTTTFAGMNGVQVYKKIKKPTDLYSLPSDNRIYKKIIIDREQQKLSVDKVKQMENFKKWQQEQ